MTDAYDHLAEWFEILNSDCDYPKWSQYFIEGLARLGAGEKGLELGCGSMLTKGEALAAQEGLKIDFIRADARTLKTPVKYDFILSPNDCFNYMPTRALPAAFRHAAACLRRGGIFWLDVSSACKLREKVANNIFADDRDDLTYLCFSTLLGDRVELDVTLFVKREDGAFCRFDEKHTQYIHEEEDILAALTGAGFDHILVEGHWGSSKEGADRLNFICRKRA